MNYQIDVSSALPTPADRPGVSLSGLNPEVVDLLRQILGDRHGRIVEAGGAGNEDPLPFHHGAGISRRLFEGIARGDQASCHGVQAFFLRCGRLTSSPPQLGQVRFMACVQLLHQVHS